MNMREHAEFSIKGPPSIYLPGWIRNANTISSSTIIHLTKLTPILNQSADGESGSHEVERAL